MTATPSAEEVLAVLRAAHPLSGNHAAALQQIQQMQTQPNFFACCAYLFSTGEGVDAFVRTQAGFQLKNNLQNPVCILHPTVREFTFLALTGADPFVRRTASLIVSSAVRVLAWDVQEVVTLLVNQLTSSGASATQIQGSILALSQIVEDSVQLLDARQLSYGVIHALGGYIVHDDEKVSLNALIALVVFLEQAGVDDQSASYQALRPVVHPLIQALLSNLSKPNPTIVENSIKSLVLTMTYHDLIEDSVFLRLCSVMIEVLTANQLQNNDAASERLQIEATEFWRGALNFPRFVQLMQPLMSHVIPLLIQHMVYSDMEIGMLQTSANDYTLPDDPADIRPRHFQAKTQQLHAEKQDHSGGDENEEDDDGDDTVEEWNLRRVSALTLDDIAEYLGDTVLMTVLTSIDAMMQPQRPWKELEAAILAIGAITEGCYDGLTAYLDSISTRLLDILEAPETYFLVRSITCWSLRKCRMYLLDVEHSDKLKRFLSALLVQMESTSKMVQEAAAAALSDVIASDDENRLNDFLLPIATTVNRCLATYQLKNRLTLFELIESICSKFGSLLATSQAVADLLLERFAHFWQTTPLDSPLSFSLYQAMGSLCKALGHYIEPMAVGIFARGYGVLQQQLALRQEAIRQNQDPPEVEFIITSVDLLSGLFEALGSSMEPLLAAHEPAFMAIVCETLVDESHEIRQSGFSIIGDVSKSCPVHVQKVLDRVVMAMQQNLANGLTDDKCATVLSNVAWSLQELMEHQVYLEGLPALSDSHLTPLFTALVSTFSNAKISAEMRNMAENCALCIGEMLFHYPDLLTRCNCPLSLFAKRWCEYVRNIKHIPARDNPVRGFLNVCPHYVAMLVPIMSLVLDLALALSDAPKDIQNSVVMVLGAVKQTAGPASWASYLGQYSSQLREKLWTVYGVS